MAETKAITQESPKGMLKTADPWIILSALFLAGIGLVMVFSAGSALAGKRYLDTTYFFKNQMIHLLVALTVMTVLAVRDYQRLKALAYPALLVVLAALVLVFIPGVGHRPQRASPWPSLQG